MSEEELRLLEQMERALSEEDPKFASTLRGTAFARKARRRVVVAGAVFVVGIAVLMAGAILPNMIVGVLGFVIMLGSAAVGLGSLRGAQHPTAAAPADGILRDTGRSGFGVVDGGRSHGSRGAGRVGRTKRPRPSGSFMERLEERWRRRRESGGF